MFLLGQPNRSAAGEWLQQQEFVPPHSRGWKREIQGCRVGSSRGFSPGCGGQLSSPVLTCLTLCARLHPAFQSREIRATPVTVFTLISSLKTELQRPSHCKVLGVTAQPLTPPASAPPTDGLSGPTDPAPSSSVLEAVPRCHCARKDPACIRISRTRTSSGHRVGGVALEGTVRSLALGAGAGLGQQVPGAGSWLRLHGPHPHAHSDQRVWFFPALVWGVCVCCSVLSSVSSGSRWPDLALEGFHFCQAFRLVRL